MKITAHFIPCEEGGYAAFAEEFPHTFAQGETLEEAREGLISAIIFTLESESLDYQENNPIEDSEIIETLEI